MMIWNMSTTVRNSDRVYGFLTVLATLQGRQWNHQTQMEYQILLIQNRLYTPKKYHPAMNNAQLSFQDAVDIFNQQNYEDPPMRGRTSFSPLKKMGFVEIDNYGNINITQAGYNIIYGNTLDNGLAEWEFTAEGANIKPYIATLHFIRDLDAMIGTREGITFNEFKYFVMTITDYRNIPDNIQQLIDMRNGVTSMQSVVAWVQQNYSNVYNIDDYENNNIRYLEASTLILVDRMRNRIRLDYSQNGRLQILLQNDNARVY